MSAFVGIKKLRQPESFKTWLFQIALNHCRRFLNKDKEAIATEEAEELFDQNEDTDEDFIPHSALDNNETRNMIMALIDALPEAQKATILLHYYEELTVEEVAGIMDCPVPTVKSRLIYARKQIKSGVLNYEKKGVKLYSLGGVPLLVLLLKQVAEENTLSPHDAINIFSAAENGANILSSVSSLVSESSSTFSGTAESSPVFQFIKSIGSFIKGNIHNAVTLPVKDKILVTAVTGIVAASGVATMVTTNKNQTQRVKAQAVASSSSSMASGIAQGSPILSESNSAKSAISPKTSNRSNSSDITHSPTLITVSNPTAHHPQSTNNSFPKTSKISKLYTGLSSSNTSSSANSSSAQSTTSSVSSNSTSSSTRTIQAETVDKNIYGNTRGNLVNGGHIASDGKWIYYSSDTDNCIYKQKANGKGKTKIVNTVAGYDLSVYNGKIYYAFKNGIKSIDTNGSNSSTLSKNMVDFMQVANGWIYYTNISDGMHICKMRIDGSGNTDLNIKCNYDFYIYGNYIFYNLYDADNNDVLYRANLDGTGVKTILSQFNDSFTILNGWIYYGSDNGGAYKIKTDGTDNTLVNSSANFWNCMVHKGFLYYLNVSTIRKMSPDGATDVSIKCCNNLSRSMGAINNYGYSIIDNKIYYYDTNTKVLYRMNLDGSENETVG